METKRRWTFKEVAYVQTNFGKKTFEDMAKELGRTPMSVRQFTIRKRMTVGCTVKRNILQELLKTAFKHPEDFHPSKTFYKETGIGQKRFWTLYYGHKAVTQKEYYAVADYLGVTLEEAFASRQLNLFEEENP
ncbi:MAG: XRE family transcriptional regulator [Prevotella shahii]|nr:XRE family transcriptional regulator [Hoylesella shahii]